MGPEVGCYRSGVLAELSTALLTLATGARHAFEPDHLAAVSTLVAGANDRRAMAREGLLWGVGHAVAVGGAAMALLPLRRVVPMRMESVLELAVACILLALGWRSVVDSRRPLPRHRHRGTALGVGFAHGLAGSGGLVATLAALEASPVARSVYVLAFGLGATGAMAALSGLFGAGLARAMGVARVRRRIRIAAGALSSAVGLGWGIRALAALVH